MHGVFLKLVPNLGPRIYSGVKKSQICTNIGRVDMGIPEHKNPQYRNNNVFEQLWLDNNHATWGLWRHGAHWPQEGPMSGGGRYKGPMDASENSSQSSKDSSSAMGPKIPHQWIWLTQGPPKCPDIMQGSNLGFPESKSQPGVARRPRGGDTSSDDGAGALDAVGEGLHHGAGGGAAEVDALVAAQGCQGEAALLPLRAPEPPRALQPQQVDQPGGAEGAGGQRPEKI